jgi:hypothetical protein
VTTNNGRHPNLGAQAGINYVATNGTLTFNPGETAKSIIIQVLHDPLVTGDVSFGLNLTNPSSPAKVGPVGSATVVLVDTEAGLSLVSTNLSFVTNADFSVTLDANYGASKQRHQPPRTVARSTSTPAHFRRLCLPMARL